MILWATYDYIFGQIWPVGLSLTHVLRAVEYLARGPSKMYNGKGVYGKERLRNTDYER